jgi:serine-protein kinase ATM
LFQLLNVPEIVPFRLTQNIVDGLGPAGTDGLFTKASEAILSLLKRNAGALLTILSAVVSDPLYSWSMSPVKARARQGLLEDDADGDDCSLVVEKGGGMASTTVVDNEFGADRNEATAQAITKIKEKLQGYEDGTSGEQQSVEGQIQLLINSARDPDKLCEMYHGWAPWL